MRAMIALGAALAGWATMAQAVDDYDDCIALIASDPVRAEREAGEWARFAGGAPARHCFALSLIEIGAASRAIDELIGIAVEEPGLEDEARAAILVQAGEMLVDEGDTVTATVVAQQALGLAPTSREALGLRAATALARDDFAAAFDDLDRALAGGAAKPRLLLLRASAYRRSGQMIAARDDALYAIELAPDSAAGWLERGRIEAALGDKASARQSLLEAISFDREGAIGKAARTALQRMEAGVD